MRKTVHSKLICSYIFIGIVGFLFATAGGSHFVETYLAEEVGARLYDSAVRFASDAVTVQQIADNDSKGLEKIMDILASGEEAGILILDKNFQVMSGVNTPNDYMGPGTGYRVSGKRWEEIKAIPHRINANDI